MGRHQPSTGKTEGKTGFLITASGLHHILLPFRNKAEGFVDKKLVISDKVVTFDCK